MEKKVRKVELIFYGYGTKQVLDLEDLDLQVDFPPREEGVSISSIMGKKLELSKKYKSPFFLKGNINKISFVGKKQSKGGIKNEKNN